MRWRAIAEFLQSVNRSMRHYESRGVPVTEPSSPILELSEKGIIIKSAAIVSWEDICDHDFEYTKEHIKDGLAAYGKYLVEASKRI